MRSERVITSAANHQERVHEHEQIDEQINEQVNEQNNRWQNRLRRVRGDFDAGIAISPYSR